MRKKSDFANRLIRVELLHETPVTKNIFRLLVRQINDRCMAKVTAPEAETIVELDIRKDVGNEGFSIKRENRKIRIVSGDERGLLYGVSKFLRTSRFKRGAFVPSSWEGTSLPACPVRGIYLAVHYNNFYEAAPEEEVLRYVEELALWGMNMVAVHFPTWQFAGFEDPAARSSLERLRTILRKARSIGIGTALIQCPNQGFKNAPKEIRFKPFPDDWKRRGYHGVNICPSNPAGRTYLLELYDRLLNEFTDIGIDYLILWPYDEGGCGCEKCWPWGARGFLRIAKGVAKLARSKYPDIRVVLSTWTFDTPPSGEWEGLTKALEEDRSWVDYILADSHEDFPRYPLERGVPGGLPLLNFPEISMWGMTPWGGYGANPLPDRLQRLWEPVKDRIEGGFAYSEGIYDDINKIIILQFYWQPMKTAAETLREYAAFEFSPEVADEVVRAVGILERNHTRLQEDAGSEEALGLLRRAEGRMTPFARSCWRWRILLLRALLDHEHYVHKGERTKKMLEALRELTVIYHAENAWPRVRPPL